MRRAGYLKLLLLIAVFAMLATPTIAGFTPSARISGQVYLVDGDDTELIGNGYTLTAKRGSTLLDSSAISDGYYSVDIDSSDASDGDDIDLYVDGDLVKTFELAGSETVDVYIAGEPAGCVESWSCGAWSEWSVCEENSQSRTRTCTDANACGTTANKPSTTSTQSCGAGGGGSGGGGGGGGGGTTGKTTLWIDESPDADDSSEDESSDADAVSEAGEASGSAITGGFIGRLTEPSVIATALATVVIVLGIFFHFRKK